MTTETRPMSVMAFIAELKSKRDSIPFVPNMDTDDLHTSESDILPITGAVYSYRFELLPARWMLGTAFVYAEGANPFHLFWQDGEDFYVLLMTDEETDTFCELARIRRHQ